MDDSALLRRYVENRSDEAFASLVERHVNLVYSVAMRCVWDAHDAEEVTQNVFILLAKKASQLRHDKALSSWLFQTTRLTAQNYLRSESRRNRREMEAHMQSASDDSASDIWPRIEPLLDEAVAGLDEVERHAIVLRFYEGRSLRDVGAALGSSEDAAQKRVSRAVERLREFFAKRGVSVGVSGLAVVLSANAVQAAPVGLALTISTAAALTGTATVANASATATKTIAMTTMQKTLVGAVLTASVGIGIYESREASELRSSIRALRLQQEPVEAQAQQLGQERDEALRQLASYRENRERLDRDNAELLKLRAEVGQLRSDNKKLDDLRTENLSLARKVETLGVVVRNWTNAPKFINPYLARKNWADQGSSEPIYALETMLAAIKQNDDAKLSQIVWRKDESQPLDRLIISKKFWENVTGVQVVDVAVVNDGNSPKRAFVGTILQTQSGDEDSQDRGDAVLQTHQTMRRWFLVQTNGQWLITGGQ